MQFTVYSDRKQGFYNIHMNQSGVIMSKYFFIFFSFFAIFGCSQEDESQIYGSGTIEATEIVVSAATAGEIIRLTADEGMPVRSGDTLAVIDHKKLMIQRALNEAQVKELDVNYIVAQKNKQQAALQLENQKKKYDRIKSLLKKESATQQQYDDSYTAYEISETQWEAAENQLIIVQAKRDQLLIQNRLILSQIDDAKILSPADGIILKRYHETGEFVTPGMALYRIANLTTVWIKIYISEAQLGKIMLNQRAALTIDSFPEKPFTGKVVWISPKAEFTPKNVQTQEARLDLVYAVKINIENEAGKLKIGMPADVEIETGE